jgi:hypothetical protein
MRFSGFSVSVFRKTRSGPFAAGAIKKPFPARNRRGRKSDFCSMRLRSVRNDNNSNHIYGMDGKTGVDRKTGEMHGTEKGGGINGPTRFGCQAGL